MQYSLVAVDIDSIIAMGGDAITQYKTYEVEDSAHKVFEGSELLACCIKMDNGITWYVVHPKANGFVVKRRIVADDNEADPVLKQWGPWDDVQDYNTRDDRLYRWFTTYFNTNFSTNSFEYDPNSKFKWSRRLSAFQPIRSKLKYGSISIYKSLDMNLDDRHTAMKPGRAISTMFPELEHKQVIFLVDKFLNEFVPRTLTISVANDRAAFKAAYAGIQSPMENIRTTHNRKSSDNSCMRYAFEHLRCHPAEAYASGDFIVVAAFDQKGLVAGRCVVYTGDDLIGPQAGPIYGVSEQALDMIEEHLGKINAETSHPHWEGAKFLALPENDSQVDPKTFIAPYLDVEPRALTICRDGKYLIQDGGGELDANNYSGVLGGYEHHCHHCGDGVDEHDALFSEYLEVDLCEECWHNEHFYCEYSQESYHNDEAVTAYRLDRCGKQEVLTVSEWAVTHGDYFVHCSDDENWHIDDAQYCEGDGEWISPDDMGDYFTSDWDEELHSVVALCNLVDGDKVSKQELEDHPGIWEKNAEGLWENTQEEMEL